MTPSAREAEEELRTRSHVRDLGLGRPPATHRDHDHVAVARQQPRHVAGNRGLPDALARPDHGQGRDRVRRELGRVEAEVGAHVREAQREHAARDPEALSRPEDRLVREVDHDLRLVRGDPGLELGDARHPVVLPAQELLGPARQPDRGDVVRKRGQRVSYHGRVVLPVDDDQRPHVRAVTSSSIRVVYFSNASVSVENWMIRSPPWNGYRRQTSTCRSATSITL